MATENHRDSRSGNRLRESFMPGSLAMLHRETTLLIHLEVVERFHSVGRSCPACGAAAATRRAASPNDGNPKDVVAFPPESRDIRSTCEGRGKTHGCVVRTLPAYAASVARSCEGFKVSLRIPSRSEVGTALIGGGIRWLSDRCVSEGGFSIAIALRSR